MGKAESSDPKILDSVYCNPTSDEDCAAHTDVVLQRTQKKLRLQIEDNSEGSQAADMQHQTRTTNSAITGVGVDASTHWPLIRFPNQHFSVYPDYVKQRTHFFVVGPETSGTRLISKIIAEDASIPNASRWEAGGVIADSKDAIFHVSLPWGGGCHRAGSSVPTLSTWGGTYNRLDPSDVSLPTDRPQRLNVDIPKLLKDYSSRGERVEVIMVVRDPEVSLMGKMRDHCSYGLDIALEEQNKAYKLLLSAKSLPHVHTVCYENLVADPPAVLHKLRMWLNTPARARISVYDGNAKHHLDATKYPCTDSLRAYRQLCPDSHVARVNAACV